MTDRPGYIPQSTTPYSQVQSARRIQRPSPSQQPTLQQQSMQQQSQPLPQQPRQQQPMKQQPMKQQPMQQRSPQSQQQPLQQQQPAYQPPRKMSTASNDYAQPPRKISTPNNDYVQPPRNISTPGNDYSQPPRNMSAPAPSHDYSAFPIPTMEQQPRPMAYRPYSDNSTSSIMPSHVPVSMKMADSNGKPSIHQLKRQLDRITIENEVTAGRDFKYGMFACLDDAPLCLKAYFLPCVTYGEIAAYESGDQDSCMKHTAFYCLGSYLGVGPCIGALQRGEVRKKRAIKG